MACLINSLDELPKVVEMEWPTTEEGWVEFGERYTCIVNGKELSPDGAYLNLDTGVAILSYYDEDSEDDIEIGFGPNNPKSNKKSSSAYARNIDLVGTTFDPFTSLTLCEKSSGGKTICGTPICDEGKEGLVITPTSTKLGNEYAGTSDKLKPTGVPQYSLYLELDTGKFYYYDNGEWNEIPCGGGSTPEDTRPYIILDEDVSPDDVLIAMSDDEFPFNLNEGIEENIVEFKDGKYYIDPDGAEVFYFFATEFVCYAINGDESVTDVSSPVEVPISPSLEIVISICSD